MKKLILICLLSVFAFTGNAQNWVFASSIGNASGAETQTFTAKDASGNLYVASNFGGTCDFGSAIKTAVGFYDAYVTKFDAQGNYQWFVGIGAAGAFTQAGGIAVDQSGNIYVAGTFTNQIVINGSGVSSHGGKDFFLFKLDPSGNITWSRAFGGTQNEEVFNISANGSSVYLCGTLTGGFTDGSVSVPSPVGANEDVFVGKYDLSNGSCQSMAIYGGTDTDYGYGITAGSNVIYITGSFKGTATFGSYTMTSTMTQPPNPVYTPDMFLVQLDQSLNVNWAIKAGARSTDQGNSLSQDANGNVYMAGSFIGQVNFGNGIILTENSGYGDGFVVKYDATGLCQWGHKIGSPVNDAANCISTDPQGNSYVCGAFAGVATLTGSNNSNRSLSTVGVTDGFVAKWSTDGTLRWAIGTGSSSADRTLAISYGSNGHCQFVVNYSGPLTAGTLGTFTPPPGNTEQLVSSYNGLTVGLNKINTIEMNIYPNPVTNGQINILTAKNDAVRYTAIYTVDGKLVQENNFIGGNDVNLNVSQLVPGNYILSVQTNEGVASEAIIIK